MGKIGDGCFFGGGCSVRPVGLSHRNWQRCTRCCGNGSLVLKLSSSAVIGEFSSDFLILSTCLEYKKILKSRHYIKSKQTQNLDLQENCGAKVF